MYIYLQDDLEKSLFHYFYSKKNLLIIYEPLKGVYILSNSLLYNFLNWVYVNKETNYQCLYINLINFFLAFIFNLPCT